jgi:hypothetical protein
MSMRNDPPRQSAVQRKRRPITHHNNEASVGHNFGTRMRPVITDPKNGRDFDGGAGPAAGGAPGQSGPPTTGTVGPGGQLGMD